jgi:hypothetical protein
VSRDRDEGGRPRNARPRDALGRPLARTPGVDPPADDPPLPPQAALVRAQQLLDDGRAFAAHEVLEAVWKTTDGAERSLWRGLAQLCVGLTHFQRGNDPGGRALLQRAAATLGEAPSLYDVDAQGLARWATSAVEAEQVPPPPRLRSSSPPPADELGG